MIAGGVLIRLLGIPETMITTVGAYNVVVGLAVAPPMDSESDGAWLKSPVVRWLPATLYATVGAKRVSPDAMAAAPTD